METSNASSQVHLMSDVCQSLDAKDAVEDDFLGFPEQRHGHGQGQQREKRQRPKAEPAHPTGEITKHQLPPRGVKENDVSHAKKQKTDKQPAIERGEQECFLPQRFVRQHRAKLFEDDIQVEQKKQRGQNEHKYCRAKESLFRHFILPVQKRAEAEVDEAKEFRAVEDVAPGTFLFLEVAHLPEAVEQQTGAGQRREEPQRFEPVGFGSFRANDQRRGQSPKQRGQAASKASE